MAIAEAIPLRSAGHWPTISHSSAYRLSQCEKSFWFDKVAKVEVPPSRAMAKGSFMHGLLGAWWGGLVPWQQAAMDMLAEWRESNSVVSEDSGEVLPAGDPEWADDMVWLMERYVAFYEDTKLELTPVAIELPFKVRIPRKYAWLTGRFDMLARDQFSRLWIVEWKTASDWDTIEAYTWAPQLTLYYWAATQKPLVEEYGQPYGILLDACKTYRWKTPGRPLEDSFSRRWLDRTQPHLDAAVSEVSATLERAKEIRKGSPPIRHVDRHCGWCAWREPCREELAFGSFTGGVGVEWDEES